MLSCLCFQFSTSVTRFSDFSGPISSHDDVFFFPDNQASLIILLFYYIENDNILPNNHCMTFSPNRAALIYMI